MLGTIGRSSALAVSALDAFYPLCQIGRVRPNKDEGHVDGWGLSGYEAGRPVDFGKEPRPAPETRGTWNAAVRAAGASGSPVLLAHFRKASVGDRALRNTHPFRHGPWLFCHNGTLFDYEKLPLAKLRPNGDPDSERLFLYLVEAVGDLRSANRAAALKGVLADIERNFPFHSLTFLLSDGAALYAYRSYSDQRLEPGESADTRNDYFTLWAAETEGVRLVCSEPILKEKISSWKALLNGELLAWSAVER